MKKTFIYIIFFFLMSSIVAQTSEQIQMVEDAKKEVKKMKGKAFPDFELTSIDGEVFSSSNTKGKIVLFNFWFTRCTPCIMEIPELNEMVEEFKSDQVVFIAPTFDTEEMVQKFLKKRAFEYEMVSDVKDFCRGNNIYSYPTHFIIGRDGTIEKVMIGYSALTVGSLKRSLRKLLKSE